MKKTKHLTKPNPKHTFKLSGSMYVISPGKCFENIDIVDSD